MGFRDLFKKSEPKKGPKVIVVEVKKPKNFKYLDNLINSGEKEINLDADIILDDNEKYGYINGIKVETIGLIVNGNGHTIDAQGKTRIFDIGFSSITFKNITFKNGFTEGNGGAIKCMFSTVKFEGCIFENNVNKQQCGTGGAIYHSSHSITITRSVFKNNKIIGDHSNGGAIYSAGDLTITNTKFLENSLEGNICNGSSIASIGNLIVMGCEFTEHNPTLGCNLIDSRAENSIIENCESNRPL